MVRKTLGAIFDVYGYTTSDAINQFQYDVVRRFCISCFIEVNIWMPSSSVKFLMGWRDCVRPRMILVICMGQ